MLARDIPRAISSIATKIDSTKIENLEVIAKRTRAPTIEEYIGKYASTIARLKLENSRYKFTQQNEPGFEFEYYIDLDETTRVLVGVAPTYITLNGSRKNASSDLLKYVKRIQQEMAHHSGPIPVDYSQALTQEEPTIRNCIGIIQFASAQMNGIAEKRILEHALEHKIGFVNLSYGPNDLERRYRNYGSGQFKRYG